MKSSIVAIGTAVPLNKFKQFDAAELISDRLNLTPPKKRLLKSIYRATGIDTRHSVISDTTFLTSATSQNNTPDQTTGGRMKLYKEHALTLAKSAIKQCMAQQTQSEPNDITHVITVSCTGMYAPGLDIELVHHLKLRLNTKRTAINFMGCYGAFNALKVADNICRSDPHALVLIASVELCSLHLKSNSELDNLLSNAIFSDGAAAALVKADANQHKKLDIEAFHCDLLPQASDAMAWEIGDHGFDIVLKSYIPEIIESGIASFMNKLLQQEKMAAVDHYAIHPGGIKILHACEAALNITKEQNKHAYQVMRDYGNMSSATILFVLKALMDDVTTNNNEESVFSCAFGPGLTLESMLLKVHHT